MYSRQPILSIITVNYNNNKGLMKTLESVKKQTFPLYEHIIIDANSTDGSEYLYFLNSGDNLTEDVLLKISFDNTKYIYGNIRFTGGRKNREEKAPCKADLIFFLTKSLPHQACFIHKSLFENQLYDINYKIIADWIHSFQCIILNECSYKHIPLVIAEYDQNGISSNYQESQNERSKWLKANIPTPFYEAFKELSELQLSAFRDVIPILNKTRKFQKRAKKIVMFLYKINSVLTRRN